MQWGGPSWGVHPSQNIFLPLRRLIARDAEVGKGECRTRLHSLLLIIAAIGSFAPLLHLAQQPARAPPPWIGCCSQSCPCSLSTLQEQVEIVQRVESAFAHID